MKKTAAELQGEFSSTAAAGKWSFQQLNQWLRWRMRGKGDETMAAVPRENAPSYRTSPVASRGFTAHQQQGLFLLQRRNPPTQIEMKKRKVMQQLHLEKFQQHRRWKKKNKMSQEGTAALAVTP